MSGMSTMQTAGTVVAYATRALQVVLGLVGAILILAPLFSDANFFEGLALTLLGLVGLIAVLVLELLARGGQRLASGG